MFIVKLMYSDFMFKFSNKSSEVKRLKRLKSKELQNNSNEKSRLALLNNIIINKGMDNKEIERVVINARLKYKPNTINFKTEELLEPYKGEQIKAIKSAACKQITTETIEFRKKMEAELIKLYETY